MTKKFRIWSPYHKKFVIEGAGFGLECLFERIYIKIKGTWSRNQDYETPTNVNSYVVQQWTGLTDSQGVEIYEGDIVEQVFHSVFSTTYEKDGKLIPVYPIGWRFEVKYRRYKMSPFDLSAENDFKVIGNIFQNPELLEKS